MRRLLWSIVLVLLTMMSISVTAEEGACDEAGTLSRETYRSAVDGVARKYTLYLPPCYTSGADTYPVLTLLHGSNADDRQWLRLGFIDSLEALIHAATAPPMIVLMPDGGAVANENKFAGTTYDTILLDFLSQMSEQLRTNDLRAIGGISRGGFWAYHLGLRFADDFVAIGGHSPYFDEDHAPAAFNPLDLAEYIDAGTHLKLWLDRGTRDYAADGVERMHLTLKRRQVPHEHNVYAGGDHSEDSWRLFISDYIAFYSSAFSSAGDAVPALLAASKRL